MFWAVPVNSDEALGKSATSGRRAAAKVVLEPPSDVVAEKL
jgi:hypothetical protein